MNQDYTIDIIGVGLCLDHISSEYKKIVDQADVLYGGPRILDFFPDYQGRKIKISSRLDSDARTIVQLSEQGQKIAVLAAGDPLFFGIGNFLTKKLGLKKVRLWPNVSALQVAASRIGLEWEQVKVVSLHGRADPTPLFAALTHNKLVGLYTSNGESPSRVAEILLERGVEGLHCHIFENLCCSDEKISTCTLQELKSRACASLNFIILENIETAEVKLEMGIDDSNFISENGLITKKHIRSIGLAALGLSSGDCLWDLGSGSGAMSIEAASLLTTGRIIAVERNPERIELIRQNIRKTKAWLVEPVCGAMPSIIDTLPRPDAIFMGGGSGNPRILQAACKRLPAGGRVVINAILLNTLQQVVTFFTDNNWSYEICQANINISDLINGQPRLKGTNPVFIFKAVKPQ